MTSKLYTARPHGKINQRILCRVSFLEPCLLARRSSPKVNSSLTFYLLRMVVHSTWRKAERKRWRENFQFENFFPTSQRLSPSSNRTTAYLEVSVLRNTRKGENTSMINHHRSCCRWSKTSARILLRSTSKFNSIFLESWLPSNTSLLPLLHLIFKSIDWYRL